MGEFYYREEHARKVLPQLVIALQVLVAEYMALLQDMQWEDEPETPALSAAINLLEELGR